MTMYQFGDSQAAITLSAMLLRPEYKIYSGRISTLLSKYNHFINEIDNSVFDDSFKKYLFRLLRKDFLDNKILNVLPVELKSFTSNIFIKNYRAAMRRDKCRNDLTRKLNKCRV